MDDKLIGAIVGSGVLVMLSVGVALLFPLPAHRCVGVALIAGSVGFVAAFALLMRHNDGT